MREIDFFDLKTDQTPREILEYDFPRLGKLPIMGGWGYDQDSACIIDKKDPSVNPNLPFDGVAWEYMFSEYRVYEELIIFRPKGQKYAGIRRQLTEQKTLSRDGRTYDVLNFEVTAFREDDFDRLKAAYEGPMGVRNPSFDAEAHQALHNSLLYTGNREYWFDITSFFASPK